jgi:hypothetical protein
VTLKVCINSRLALVGHGLDLIDIEFLVKDAAFESLSIPSGVAATTTVAYPVDGTVSSVSSKITVKDPISMEAIEAAPQSSYSYTGEFKTSIPTENVCSTQNLMNASFTLHRKAAKRTFPWELGAEEINLAMPKQVEDI